MSRPLAFAVIVALAAALWFGRAHGDLPDFEVYRTAAARATVVAALVVTGFTIFDLLGRWLYSRAMELSVVTIAAIVMIGPLVQLRRAALA